MFNNRAIQMQMVKKPKQTIDETKQTRWSLEQTNKFIKTQMKNVVVVAVSVYAAKVILDTSSQIAIHAASVKIR